MKKHIPKVSVIVPVYKVEKYLNRCLESIVIQTLKDIEIILVDDGSPDECPALCDAWMAKDIRIKVIHKVNEGLGFARNSGIEVATGEYIIFCDSDDEVEPNMYEVLYEATECGKYDVVYSGFEQELEGGRWQRYNNYPEIRTYGKSFSHKVAMSFIGETDITCGHRYVMSCNVALYKRQLLEKYHIRQMSEREVLSEDLIFQIHVALHGENFKFIPDCFYHYYKNNESLTHSFKQSKFGAAFRIREVMKEIMSDKACTMSLIDFEFYSRIRSLFTQMVCESSLSIYDKYNISAKVCSMMSVIALDESLIHRKSWKFGALLKFIKWDMPLSAVLFAYFDKYVNKQTLYFWKRK